MSSGCCKYTAGDLKAVIRIERKTRVADDMGGFTETWAAVGSPWSMVKILSGSELWRAQRINPVVVAKAVIRFRGGANGAPYYLPSDRVIYKGREFAISAVIDPDDREQWLELSLREGEPS